jgi:hypothetical protein
MKSSADMIRRILRTYGAQGAVSFSIDMSKPEKFSQTNPENASNLLSLAIPIEWWIERPACSPAGRPWNSWPRISHSEPGHTQIAA